MRRKPPTIVYDVDERPPWGVVLGMGAQHCLTMSTTIVLAVLVVDSVGGSDALAAQFVSATMIAAGLGTVLQSLRHRVVGSGYLCPMVAAPTFFPASLMAAKTGGLSLVLGMTMVAGALQGLLALLVHRLRPYLPPEVTGVIVTMVGVVLVPVGVSGLAGLGPHDATSEVAEIVLGLICLAVIFGLSIWGGKALRLYAVSAGLGLGYAAAGLGGIWTPSDLAALSGAPLFALPVPPHPLDLTFDPALLVPFLVAGLVATMVTLGNVSTAQRINDETWSGPNMDSVRGGIAANAVALLGAGLVGGMAQGTYPANVGLSLATGVTSRWVGFAAGGMFVACAFFPVLALAFVLMPTPVKGAITTYVACFILVAGLQLIMTRMMDTRKIFVIGGSIIAGLSVDLLPNLYSGLPSELHAVTASPLSLAAVVAILLNLVCRVGIARRATLDLDSSGNRHEEVVRFMDRIGGAWGARSEVIGRATGALLEIVDMATPAAQAGPRIRVNARIDDLHLDLRVLYGGPPISFPEAAPDPNLVATDAGYQSQLSGHLVRATATRAHQTRRGELNLLHLRFAL